MNYFEQFRQTALSNITDRDATKAVRVARNIASILSVFKVLRECGSSQPREHLPENVARALSDIVMLWPENPEIGRVMAQVQIAMADHLEAPQHAAHAETVSGDAEITSRARAAMLQETCLSVAVDIARRASVLTGDGSRLRMALAAVMRE